MLPSNIRDKIEKKFGIDYTILGQVTIETIISEKRQKAGLKTNEEYFKLISHSELEFNDFVESLLVPETWFIRDKAPFSWFIQWAEEFRNKDICLKILSIPCSTGEEPYSIAISLLEAKWTPDQFQIIGSDISEKYINLAKRGCFKKRSFRGADTIKYHSYFNEKERGLFELKNEFKNTVKFIKGNILDNNLLRDQGPFHAIFSRNVLIYFTNDARKKALITIDNLLDDKGMLFLGHADNLYSLTESFEPVGPPEAFAYKKKLEKDKLRRPTIKPKNDIQQPEAKANHEHGFKFPTSALREAQKLADAGKNTEAQYLITKYLKEGKYSAEAYFLLGQIFEEKKNLEEAEAMLKKALFLDPDHEESIFQLELLSIQKGDLEQAERYRKRKIRIEKSKFNGIR